MERYRYSFSYDDEGVRVKTEVIASRVQLSPDGNNGFNGLFFDGANLVGQYRKVENCIRGEPVE